MMGPITRGLFLTAALLSALPDSDRGVGAPTSVGVYRTRVGPAVSGFFFSSTLHSKLVDSDWPERVAAGETHFWQGLSVSEPTRKTSLTFFAVLDNVKLCYSLVCSQLRTLDDLTTPQSDDMFQGYCIRGRDEGETGGG